ncbi:hypothetical protein Tco_0868926 [Tanacetum coccineum]
MVAKKPPSVEKITPTVISKGTGDKPGVPDVTNDDSSVSESESWEQESDSEQDEESNDDDQEKDEFDQENESEDDEMKSDKEQVMDDTTDQFDDDADARLEEPTKTATGIVQGAHVTISTVTKTTEVPATSSSRSSDLASKFLNFSDIPHTDAEIVSPFDVPVQHEVPNTQTTTLLPIHVSVITTIPQSLHTFTPPPLVSTPTPPPTTEATNPLSTLPDFASVFRFNDRITSLEKEVAELKKDPLHTQVTTLVDEHLDTRLGETREEFMNFLSESLTARIKEQLIKESRYEVTLAKVSSQPQSTYEAASTLTKFELKKILLDKIEKNKDKDEDPSAGSDLGLKKRKLSKDAEPTTGPEKKDSTSASSKGTKSQPKSSGKSVQSKEPVFEVADSDMPQDQEENLGDNEDEPRNATASRCDWFKKPTPPQEPTNPDWHENPKGGDYLFDLSKPLPLIKHGKRQRVPFEFFINNDLKYLQGGSSTMTYLTSTTKTKVAKYDLPGIEDMVPNIWSPVKVAYDRYALWGDVYSTKRILAVTYVKVMRKHGYEYLEEIIIRRSDKALYRFKEGDFPRLRINDIEDILLLVVQNWLTNLSGDDVADFAIALRMFTRSLVIQKRVEDLQLGVEKYRHGVLAEEKMEQFGKEKSSFHDQGHQQAAKGNEDDEEFGEIRWWHRYSNPMIQLEPEGSTQGYPLVSVEVLRYDTKGEKVRIIWENLPTKREQYRNKPNKVLLTIGAADSRRAPQTSATAPAPAPTATQAPAPAMT